MARRGDRFYGSAFLVVAVLAIDLAGCASIPYDQRDTAANRASNSCSVIQVACQEALVAAQRGNYGVGAVLVNPRGTVVGQGQNTVFYPHFRSDLHAEMVVMNAFEDRHPEVDSMRGYTLLCSIEPCPMCASPVFWPRG